MGDVIAVLGLEDSRPVSTPSLKRTPTTESLVELENAKRAVYKKKDHVSHRERQDEREAHREILERCPEVKVLD